MSSPHSHIEMHIPERKNLGQSQSPSPVVQLESIHVRKHQPTIEELEEKKQASGIKLEHLGFRRQSQQLAIAVKNKQLNLSSIPDSIRTQAIFHSGVTVGPRKRFRSISTQRQNAADVNN